MTPLTPEQDAELSRVAVAEYARACADERSAAERKSYWARLIPPAPPNKVRAPELFGGFRTLAVRPVSDSSGVIATVYVADE
jgi:hypothetical protein